MPMVERIILYTNVYIVRWKTGYLAWNLALRLIQCFIAVCGSLWSTDHKSKVCQAGTLKKNILLTKIQDGHQRTFENHIFAHNFAPMSHRDLVLMAKHMFCGSMKTMEYK